jgi:hypothetical protein
MDARMPVADGLDAAEWPVGGPFLFAGDPCILDLKPLRKLSGTVPIFRSGTVRRMVGEKNGTVPFSQTVFG